MTDDNWLTYRAAARRVHRSVKTIKRWRRNGLPMTFNPHGERIVREVDLLKYWRARMAAWPPHQYRLRRMRRQSGEEA